MNGHTNQSGSGGNAVEAIADLLSISRLPPGHDPGVGYGVATAARQRWHLAIRHFGLFGGPLAAANDSRAYGRTIREHEQAAETAPPGHGPADHGRSRRSGPTTAVTAGHGRPRRHGNHGRPRPDGVTADHGRTFLTGVMADAANAALANDTVARPIRVNERANGRIERPTPPGTRPRGYCPAAGGADGRIERPAPPGTLPRSRRSRDATWPRPDKRHSMSAESKVGSARSRFGWRPGLPWVVS